LNIHPTAIVDPSARISDGVTIGPYAVIEGDVTIGKGTSIGPHAVIKQFVEIGRDNRIYQFASVGEVPQDLKFGNEKSKLVIGDRNTIREFTTLNRGTEGGGGVTRIGNDCFLMSYTHVAHDCQLGNNVIIANSVQMGGHVHIDDHVVVGGLSAIHQFCHIGEHCMLGGASALSQDAPPYMLVTGYRAYIRGLNLIGLSRRGFSKETISALKKTFKVLFSEGLKTTDALTKARSEVASTPEVEKLLAFIENSKRGVCTTKAKD
jgi:UDP-N-acetylglucosamine acyltransferase